MEYLGSSGPTCSGVLEMVGERQLPDPQTQLDGFLLIWKAVNDDEMMSTIPAILRGHSESGRVVLLCMLSCAVPLNRSLM